MTSPKIHSKPIRLIYFLLGAIATIAYRVIILLSGVNEAWLNFCWYIGTIGFVIYFAHRYQISEKRAKLILDYNLQTKVSENSNLNPQEKEVMNYIFESLKFSSERWIYIIIFATSALALLAGIYLDFIK